MIPAIPTPGKPQYKGGRLGRFDPRHIAEALGYSPAFIEEYSKPLERDTKAPTPLPLGGALPKRRYSERNRERVRMLARARNPKRRASGKEKIRRQRIGNAIHKVLAKYRNDGMHDEGKTSSTLR